MVSHNTGISMYSSITKLRVRTLGGSRLGWYTESMFMCLAELTVVGATEKGVLEIFYQTICTVLAIWESIWDHSANSVEGSKELVKKHQKK